MSLDLALALDLAFVLDFDLSFTWLDSLVGVADLGLPSAFLGVFRNLLAGTIDGLTCCLTTCLEPWLDNSCCSKLRCVSPSICWIQEGVWLESSEASASSASS